MLPASSSQLPSKVHGHELVALEKRNVDLKKRIKQKLGECSSAVAQQVSKKLESYDSSSIPVSSALSSRVAAAAAAARTLQKIRFLVKERTL